MSSNSFFARIHFSLLRVDISLLSDRAYIRERVSDCPKIDVSDSKVSKVPARSSESASFAVVIYLSRPAVGFDRDQRSVDTLSTSFTMFFIPVELLDSRFKIHEVLLPGDSPSTF